MRISLNWLKELVGNLDLTAEQLGERLTGAGLELEGIERFGAGLESVKVAQVRSKAPHPTREKLQLVTVWLEDLSSDPSAPNGKEQTIVCGASNVPEPGGLVVLAELGTYLPAVDMKLEPRPIGGVVSEGMLCSERELGLAEDSEGILILQGDHRPGTPLPEAIPACQDWILEIGITPNRPDALGHVGVAREISAILGLPWDYPNWPAPHTTPSEAGAHRPNAANQAESKLGVAIETVTLGKGSAITERVAIDNRDFERCPHYAAMLLTGVQVAKSPEWLRWRLSALGVRPISNLVDITNFMLMKFGQPMHAFDYELLASANNSHNKKTIIIRRAEPREAFKSLDGVARELTTDDLVIADAAQPIALAGIMGGESTEIHQGTQSVLLECAYFTPQGVRRSARHHGLSSESSFRFERGVDFSQIHRVLEEAAIWVQKLAGGEPTPGILKAQGPAEALPEIRLRKARIESLLGVELPFEESLCSLGRLGFQIVRRSDSEALVRGAAHRPDIQMEADLIEEVARIAGLDSIPTVLPAIEPQPLRPSGLESTLSRLAVELGLSEAITYSFVSPKELSALKAPAPAVSVINPLTELRSVMRTSLLPGLLEALRRARRRGEHHVRLFNIGPIFLKPKQELAGAISQGIRPTLPEDLGRLPDEQPYFAALLAGPRPEYLTGKPQKYDIYDIKGVAVELVERALGRQVELSSSSGEGFEHLHPRGAAQILVDNILVGRLGPLHPDVVQELDLDGEAQVLELDLRALESLGFKQPKFRPIPRLPAVTRDLALVVPAAIQAGEVERLIREAAGPLCESVQLFDIFSGKDLPEGHRSLAFHVIYRDPSAAAQPDQAKTLTDKEVDLAHQRAVEQTSRAVGATLRA